MQLIRQHSPTIVPIALILISLQRDSHISDGYATLTSKNTTMVVIIHWMCSLQHFFLK